MFKFAAIFALLVAVSSAGLIGHGIAVAPAIAPVAVHAPAASSYQNSNLLALHATPVVAAAPVAKVAVAAPALAIGGHGLGLGHGLGFGLHH
ncbi:cuticle protein 65 [Agrilus planipennis]|uniref:Cuticle protein 65 n=1 Tax=Agrilus planipennis TaxID=224129 RepID=A0A1W4WFS8_AGRPL|nr:cuticle protein 65 [Agrilus planipennis]